MTRRRAFRALPLAAPSGQAALGDRDQPLDERPQLLGLWHRRREVLVAKQGRRLVPQHRDAVLGDAAQFSVCDSMSHGFEGQAGGPGSLGFVDSCKATSPPSRGLRALPALRSTPARPTRLVHAHAEAQPHRVQDFLDLVQALAAEVLGLQHLAFGLLHQLANRPDVRVLQTVVGADRELELFDRLVEVLVADAGARLIAGRFGLRSAPSSRLMKMFR